MHFGEGIINKTDDSVIKKVILAPTNNDVIDLNKQVLAQLEGDLVNYLSVDSADDDKHKNLDMAMPIKFLNSLRPNGMPLHNLALKEGSIVILLRNLNPKENLCKNLWH